MEFYWMEFKNIGWNLKIFTNARVKLKYQHLITNSFVQCNRLLRWCPSPDCSNAVKVQVSRNRLSFHSSSTFHVC